MCVGSTGWDRSVGGLLAIVTAEWGQELLPPPQKQHSMDPPVRAARGGGFCVLVVPMPFPWIKESSIHTDTSLP